MLLYDIGFCFMENYMLQLKQPICLLLVPGLNFILICLCLNFPLLFWFCLLHGQLLAKLSIYYSKFHAAFYLTSLPSVSLVFVVVLLLINCNLGINSIWIRSIEKSLSISVSSVLWDAKHSSGSSVTVQWQSSGWGFPLKHLQSWSKTRSSLL